MSPAATLSSRPSPVVLEVLPAGDVVPAAMAAWMSGLAANGQAMRVVAADRSAGAGAGVDLAALASGEPPVLPRFR